MYLLWTRRRGGGDGGMTMSTVRRSGLRRPDQTPTPYVEVTLNYVSDERRGMHYVLDDERSTLPLMPTKVRIFDARCLASPPTLAQEGFTIVKRAPSVQDYLDPEQLDNRFIPDMRELLREVTLADEVLMLRPVVRLTDKATRAANLGAPDAAYHLHLDFTDALARDHLYRFTGAERSYIDSFDRIVVYNTWRSISPPPQDIGLALCDKRSVSFDDMSVADAFYGIGPLQDFAITVVKHNENHRWWYYSHMAEDEVVVFKGWDLDPHPTPSVVHGAFRNPDCPPGAPPRASIELRGYALFRGRGQP